MRRLLAVVFVLALGCNPLRPPAAPDGAGERGVSVAAAADLKFAFDALVPEFRKRHPDIEVKVTYGSSGTFGAQLENRAPFDLFLAADEGYPRRLVEQG